MKLLFDENLSPRLPELLAQDYPHSVHVRAAGLRGAQDIRIWDYCRERDLTIVTKDTDFRERSLVEGFPPKVIWLDVGNAGTKTIVQLLREKHIRIEAFINENESSILILSLTLNPF